MKDKFLIIRMTEPGDVLAIGLPAIRYFQKRYPNAEISFLTYGESKTFVQLGEPGVTVISLPESEWSDNIVQAMEQFLGLAERTIGEGYTSIINLDTAFMPCFLARFLKEAGEPLQGNMLSYSIGELIDGLQKETLSQDKVSLPQSYIQSSWLTFGQWFTRWWETPNPPEQGYPGFYLQRCCGWSDLSLNMELPVKETAGGMPYIALYLEGVSAQLLNVEKLLSSLNRESIAYKVLSAGMDIIESLQIVKSAKLLVTVPAAYQWYARATDTPVLLVSGEFDPRITMPDYATIFNQTVDADVVVQDIAGLLEAAQDA